VTTASTLCLLPIFATETTPAIFAAYHRPFSWARVQRLTLMAHRHRETRGIAQRWCQKADHPWLCCVSLLQNCFIKANFFGSGEAYATPSSQNNHCTIADYFFGGEADATPSRQKSHCAMADSLNDFVGRQVGATP
jgi:hypothetical protein